MPLLKYTPRNAKDSVSIQLNENESVLEGLLRSGFNVPYGCQAGICHSCIMSSSTRPIPITAQHGLKSSQKEAGQFLSCSCIPSGEFCAVDIDASRSSIRGEVVEKTPLNQKVYRLRLMAKMDYKPGQFVNLWRNETIARSYSIASIPEDGYLEFHIKHVPEGAFSHWAWENVNPEDTIDIQGPLGECFYSLDDQSKPILLSGIGTGLAPLYGIVRDALSQGHTGPITFILGACEIENFYMIDELALLAEQNKNVSVHYVAYSANGGRLPEPAITHEGDVYQKAKEILPSLKNYAVYLCGAESFVKKMKRQCYLQDASLSEIFADAFKAASK